MRRHRTFSPVRIKNTAPADPSESPDAPVTAHACFKKDAKNLGNTEKPEPPAPPSSIQAPPRLPTNKTCAPAQADAHGRKGENIKIGNK